MLFFRAVRGPPTAHRSMIRECISGGPDEQSNIGQGGIQWWVK
jgi:hypothetical protein